MPIDILKINELNAKRTHQVNNPLNSPSNSINSKQPDINNTLKGVLLNNHIKSSATDNYISFDEIKDSLLINDSGNNSDEKIKTYSESSFDTKKALKPLLIGTAVVIAGAVAITSVLKHASSSITKAHTFEQLPDLAVNMNIREEPQFALYRAIRDPNSRNILGAIGVFVMSGLTIAFKNFTEGTKDIWLKKQSADVEKTLQENLIDVEKKSFSGKLKVVNDLMDKNVKYFDGIINGKKSQNKTSDIFSCFAFKGKDENTEQANTSNKKNWKYIMLGAGVLGAAILAGKVSLANLRKTSEITNEFANNFAQQTIDSINEMSQKADKGDLPKIRTMLQNIAAKPAYIKEVASKYNLPDNEVQSMIDEVERAKKTIFADAPLALGGIPKKIQYYCYIDEDRGHLYNWILNPKNKFTKYVFLAFTSSSIGGYLFKTVMDAVKDATVIRENAKTDLNLRKRLVDVEIANFRAKKESAIQPLVDNFTKQANNGSKSNEELKQLADNILMEIKNGPPYVYS